MVKGKRFHSIMAQQRDFTKGFRHATLHRIAAVLWLGLAGALFVKGVGLVQRAFSGEGGAPFKEVTYWAGGSESAVSLLIAFGVIIGLLKGRFALRRSALRLSRRISLLPTPAPLWRLFGLAHYLLVIAMVGIGMGMRAIGVPPEVRGTLLIGVGVALTTGSLTLLKSAISDSRSPS